jgi:L-rhamnose isomerase
METLMPDTAYRIARDLYAEHGVNTETALAELARVPISMHCWQGDDVTGFERSAALGGGLAATAPSPASPARCG